MTDSKTILFAGILVIAVATAALAGILFGGWMVFDALDKQGITYTGNRFVCTRDANQPEKKP